MLFSKDILMTHRFHFTRLLVVVSSLFLVASTSPAAEPATVDFSQDIRPILARKCYACHGPSVQEAGLSLHNFETATSETETGIRAIVPGDLEQSELIYRITATDPVLRMPPEEHEA